MLRLLSATAAARPWRAAAVALFLALGGLATVQAATDPSGDTLGVAAPQLDLVAIDGYTTPPAIVLRLTLAAPIAAGDSGAANALQGLVEMDVDRSPATGGASQVGLICPQGTPIGVDYTVDLFHYSSAAGTAPVLNAQAAIVGQAAVTFSGNQVTMYVPKSLVGSPAAIDVATTVGTPGELTDCMPNADVLTVPLLNEEFSPAVPTLAPLGVVLLARGLGWLAVARLRRAGRGKAAGG